MNVALFTKFFLEPTHIAIAQVLRGLPEVKYRVVAKGFQSLPGIEIPNASMTFDLTQGICPAEVAADCDVVHAIYDGHIAFDAFQISEALQKPFILSFHGGFDTNAKIWKPRMRETTVAVASRATRVTVVSATDARRLRELGITRDVDIVPVPVDLRLVNTPAAPAGNHVLAIGRLVPKKGFDIAIKCMRRLPDDFRLTIIGSGPEAENLRDLAEREGVVERVNFAGYLSLDAMLSRLATARVLLHPARSAEDGNAEATPQVVLWSQALRVPVVAGASGSVGDVVVDGVTGRLLANGDVEEFASTVEAVCRDGPERERIIAGARAFAVDRHGLTGVLQQWRRLYRAALEDGGGPVGRDVFDLLEGKNARYRDAFESAQRVLGSETKYILLESGGQGTVYVADSPLFGRQVLKVANYRTDVADDAALTELRLRKEAEALTVLGRLGCHCVPQLNHADARGRFLIRELIEGATLQDMVLGSTAEERLRLLDNVWRTADELFRFFHGQAGRPYLVRDLKPRNLVIPTVSERGMVLIDVGSVKAVVDSEASARSKARQRLGTRNWLYWAPEMLMKHGSGASVRSDYFSFAATSFYTVLGQPPYTNGEVEKEAALAAYLREYNAVRDMWAAACLRFQLAPQLARFVEDALHPEVTRRPEKMIAHG